LHDAIHTLVENKELLDSPLIDSVAAISVGVKNKTILLDLDYEEDSECDTDMNVVMTGSNEFIEIQGTAEGIPFSKDEMDQLIKVAQKGIEEITGHQQALLKK